MILLLCKATVSVIFLLILVLYGSTHFYRDPGSIFFDRTRAFEQRYSLLRKAETQQFIADFQAGRKAEAAKNRSLCISLSSVGRKETSYLETTIASILQGLTTPERSDLYINILNAEPDPSHHPSWNRSWLHDAVDRFDGYSFKDPQEETYITGLAEKEEFAEKGVYDYRTALQRCLDTDARYVAVFEDDVLLANGWLMQALSGLDKIAATTVNQYLFMRLFNQERSIGWAGKNIGENHEYPIIFGITLFVSLSSMAIRRRWQWTRRYLDVGTLLAITGILIPGLVILFYQCGKASLLPPSPGVVEESFGCCSQALIFPRESISPMMDYLQERKSGQVDLMLDQLAVERGYARYALYPVQAQHIGLESARKTQRDEAQAVWSMAFEDLEPKKLEAEHLRLARLRYGSEARA
ncbi:unnamed protein product [Zymoseptoria tritici ST99CH_1E4]|uniref:Uncharacterized protein n=1 Tax=Zymoseptoria tritici ST99CH_1E4 TaxID=1276532 RepID=A0A2H1GZ51_ZYMTR|nr:unnamed protein product [Zymoseptoria tritici ST99CH_1E4]